MCGIAGVATGNAARARATTQRMCEQMVARGPDDGGVDVFPLREGTVALGSRRLAIIDPSAAGHQPMIDPATGNAIVFNGMIYNFRDLRRELASAGAEFASGSDTEVILRSYARWGVECVERLEGMFAFALLDVRSRSLVLARDRLGIKPLYYWRTDEHFAFASQVRALLASGLVRADLSVEGIASFLSTGAVREPLTAIEGVRALPAGHMATFDGTGMLVERYWSPPRRVDAAVDRSDAQQELLARLDESVDRHLVADRPVGVFLSGGLDSSTLGALAARRGAVETIGVAFEEAAYSEGSFSRLVANEIGSRHTEVVLTESELRSSLDAAFAAMDQPSFDGVNTYVVSRAAASAGLKVALSGLGADELFDGYGHLRRIQLLRRLAWLPRPAARLGSSMAGVSGDRRATKIAQWLQEGVSGPDAAYRLIRQLYGTNDVSGLLPGWSAESAPDASTSGDPSNDLAVAELEGYMRNVLLRDTDMMSMANSLEVRVPFLHDPFVDWALRLPRSVKGPRKSLLVAALRPLLPRQVLERRKHGFLLPIGRWLHGALGDEVAERVASPPPSIGALIDGDAALRELRAFRAGRTSWLRPWSLYALCRWAAEVGV